MKIRIHVILDELDRQIVEVVRSFPGVEIVQWDYSFDTAYQWTVNNREERVDIFLASEYAQVSNTDEHGKQIPRDKALLRRIRDLYIARPYVKFLLLCDPDRRRPGNREFLTNLVTIGIYDFRTEETLTEEMLEEFIREPKRDISYVAEFLPGGFENVQRYTSHDVKQFELEEEEEEEEESLLPLLKQRLIDMLKTPRKPKKKIKVEKAKKVKKEKVEEVREGLPIEVDIPVPKPIPSIGTIYALELGLDKGIVNFNTWEQLLIASNMVAPNIIVLSSNTRNLIQRIKYLKENYKTTVVVIGDVSGNEVLRAGADAYFKEWDDVVYEKLMSDIGTRDSLTGLYDRKYFEAYLDKQVSQYQSQKRPFSILMIDIDFFKKVNDTYGHPTGDKVLIKFASFLSANTRNTDVVARYGGEEFVIIFPDTTKEMAEQIGQQLRYRWHSKGIPEITFSGGIAEFYKDSNTAEGLVNVADQALYKAKESGRDKICVAGEKARSVPIVLSKPGRMRNQVIVVAGAAPRVGATSFCLALAGFLAQKYSVEVVDAGGGAYDWVTEGDIRVRKSPPLSITPGMITLIDAGHYISDELQPYANMVFLVTDLSRNSVYFKDFIEKSNNICLVGNRGASLRGLHELGELWGIKVIGTLSEESIIREAEINGQIVVPKKWRKQLQKVRRLF